MRWHFNATVSNGLESFGSFNPLSAEQSLSGVEYERDFDLALGAVLNEL